MSSIPVPDEQTYYSSRRQDDADALTATEDEEPPAEPAQPAPPPRPAPEAAPEIPLDLGSLTGRARIRSPGEIWDSESRARSSGRKRPGLFRGHRLVG